MAERNRTLSAAEWARAIFEHWKAQQPKGKSMSEEAFAEHAKLSRGGFRKVLDGDSRPRFDTLQKLRAVAPPHLRDFDVEKSGTSAEMSGGRSINAGSNLEALLDQHARDLSYEDVKRLRAVALKVDKPGVVLTVDEWREIAEAVLNRSLADPAGGGAGG